MPHRAVRPHHVVRPIPVKRARNTGRLPAHPALTPHAVGNPFGVGTFVAQRGHPEEGRLIRRTRALGIDWVREEITASAVHGSVDGRYHWGAYDRVINAEIAAGIHVLGLLDYSNSWGYASHAVMPPADMAGTSADFAAFAAAAARHFRGRIRYWQVWNEPDLSVYWQPKPSAGDYAVLLSAAYRAIKAVSPSDRVVLAGTSGVDLSFIRAVARRTSDFDVLAVHPYREQPETDLLRQVRALRSFHRPIWFTEIGWPGGNACLVCSTESEQAADLVRLYSLAIAAGVQRVFWYDLRDDARGVSPTETHYELLFRNLFRPEAVGIGLRISGARAGGLPICGGGRHG